MAIKALNTSNIEAQRVFGVVGGYSETGKTTLAGTLPKENTIIISVEAGTLALAGTGHTVWECETLTDYKWCMEALRKGVDVTTGEPLKFEVKNLFVDSISELLYKKFAEVEIAVKAKEEVLQKKLTFDLYGDFFREAIAIVKELRDFTKYNIWMSCLIRKEKDGTVFTDVWDLNGQKIQSKWKALFDFIFITDVEKTEEGEIKYSLICKGTEHELAKSRDRFNRLQPKEEADLSKIINKILQLED